MKKIFLVWIILAWISIGVSAEYRILAFGDSNTWGWKPNGGGVRFSDEERWAGVLKKELGEGYMVICDGLVARRTNIDGNTVGSIDGSFLNAAKTLPVAIARNAPLDLVILFLGTNDLQSGAERSATEVAVAVGELVQMATQSENLLYSSFSAPEVWVVVPPAFGDLSNSALKDLFGVGQEESGQLSSAFNSIAESSFPIMFHANKILVEGIGSDGIHLNKRGHELLGKALSRAVDSKLVEK